MWARYLGRMSTITYTSQLKKRILTDKDDAFEMETDGLIDVPFHSKIKNLLVEKDI
jgi:hypothetical protein